MSTKDFFEESKEQSRIKAQIVTEYFKLWAKVVIPTAKKKGGKIAYIDLFAGPGRYNDETKSTPLLILENAIQDPDMRNMLLTLFNDINKANTISLEQAISEIPGINTLKYFPEILNEEVGTKIVDQLNSMSLVPSLFFVDPWGYKGLSLKLINSVVQNWGCDSIFFFNYNRINMGINNNAVEGHIDALFGQERADNLRKKINNLDPHERELTIVNEIAQALKDMGMRFVLPFRFRDANNKRTKHHLIFVSKHFKGYDLMKYIMANYSSERPEGVPTFEYNESSSRQPMFDIFKERPLSDLKNDLLIVFKGQTIQFSNLYKKHSIDTRFIEENYKEALRQLEAEGRIRTNPPADKRQKRKEKVTFGETVVITFP